MPETPSAIAPQATIPAYSERVVQSAVHRRRLADPANEKYTNWWVATVIDAIRDLPLHDRMELMGMDAVGLAPNTPDRVMLYAERGTR